MTDTPSKDSNSSGEHQGMVSRIARVGTGDRPITSGRPAPVDPKAFGAMQDWWTQTAGTDVAAAAPKALEYGASDLLVMGAALAPNMSDAVRIETGIAAYANGKAARIISALTEGRSPSDDSWADLAIYSFMGRYVREFGRWP